MPVLAKSPSRWELQRIDFACLRKERGLEAPTAAQGLTIMRRYVWVLNYPLQTLACAAVCRRQYSCRSGISRLEQRVYGSKLFTYSQLVRDGLDCAIELVDFIRAEQGCRLSVPALPLLCLAFLKLLNKSLPNLPRNFGQMPCIGGGC